METKKFYKLQNFISILFLILILSPYGIVWAGHDEGQGKSQHPDHEIAVAPEPSGLLLYSVGGAIVAYRCWKKKRE